MTKAAWSAFLILAVLPSTRAADESDQLFKHEGPLPCFKIEVDKDNVEQLRREPRKYAKCTVHVGDETFRDVGIHIKGAAGSSRPWDDKPALTLEFGKSEAKQRFRGLDKIHLNNSVQDPRYMTEILSAEMFLAADVPTARATHALVELNGRKVGLYVLKEGYDTAFLKRHFGGNAGNLYDGGFLQDIDAEPRRTHGSADVPDRSDLRAAAAASRERDLAERFAKVDKLVDIDRFMKMAAIEVLTWHWDGYAMHKNNYRVYHDLKSNKLIIIPHGMDQLWWDPNGSIQPRFEGLIARKLVETTEGRDRYRKAVGEMLEKVHKTDELNAKVDKLLVRLKEQLRRDNKELYQDIEQHCQGLKSAIRAREDYVRKQLEKTTQ
jgi:spore coat protein CotH